MTFCVVGNRAQGGGGGGNLEEKGMGDAQGRRIPQVVESSRNRKKLHNIV